MKTLSLAIITTAYIAGAIIGDMGLMPQETSDGWSAIVVMMTAFTVLVALIERPSCRCGGGHR